MFASIRKALSLGVPPPETHHPASLGEVAAWAARRGAALEPDDLAAGDALSGQQAGIPWRIECGTPTRSYIQGMELRGGAQTGAAPGIAVMVLGRALQESLEGAVHGDAASAAACTGSGPLPEEVRWLARCEEVGWDGWPAAFLRHFAVLSAQIEPAQRWLRTELITLLARGVAAESPPEQAGAAPADAPLVLLLSRGNVYLRMGHASQSLQSLAWGLNVLTTAARVAAKGLRSTP